MAARTAALPRTVAKRLGPARYRLVCEGHEFICQQWAYSAYYDPPHWYQRGMNWHLSDTGRDGAEGFRIASFSLLTHAKTYVSEYIAHQQQPLPEATVTRIDDGTYRIDCSGRTWWLWDHAVHGVTDADLALSDDKPWLLMIGKPTLRAALWAYPTIDEAVHSCRTDAHDDQWQLRVAEANLIK